jgi:hypothetical protein
MFTPWTLATGIGVSPVRATLAANRPRGQATIIVAYGRPPSIPFFVYALTCSGDEARFQQMNGTKFLRGS